MAKDKYDNDELTEYYAKIYEEIDKSTADDPFGSYILGRVKGGQKTVFNKSQSEIRNFDMSFLDTIESVYPALTKIMRDPKKSIRYEQEVVAVEKAKKVNADTVRHLSSHTQLIKEIKKNGDVIPSKVLNTFAEEELAIYENRFIKSLVKRTEMFLERRYEVMKISLESFETEKLEVKNEFKLSGQFVTIGVEVAIKNDLTTNVETTKEQFDRLCRIREMVQGLKGTEFMRTLAKARDVLPPIMKTNIILHNPDFKLCYGLWLYLDRVDSIATNIDVKEKSYKYSPIFDKDINQCMALALTSFIKNRQIEGIYSSKRAKELKAPKPIVDNEPELELNLEADNKQLEDYTMNELLLSQTAKFFEASMDGMQRTGQTYNESIRVVYRQMLDMLDQIYPMAFGVADDELESKDLYEQLEYARRQLMVFKIVHQQKQMNIARMGKESKRIEKLIQKLEEKIKKEEARERERLERERLKIEAERQAEIERQKAMEARKRKFEQDAIEKAKEVELRRQEMENQEKAKDAKRREKLSKLYDAHAKKRDHMKERQEADNANWDELTPQEIAAQEPTAVPIRRRDEYDDLSDEELAALMAENELLLDQIPEKDSELQEEQEKVQALEDKANAEPKKKKPTKKEEAKPEPKKKDLEDMDLDDLSDEDLDALLMQNGLEGDDFNFNMNDISDDAPKKEEKAKPTIGKKKPAKKAEPEPTPDSDISDDISDEELDKLLADNGITDENPSDVIPEEPKEEAKPKPTIKKKAKKDEPKEEPKEEPSDISDDISDEELDKLLADNGIADEAPQDDSLNNEEPLESEPESVEEPDSEPQEEEAQAEPEAEAEPESEPEADSSDDDLDNISDEDLDALLKENGMI